MNTYQDGIEILYRGLKASSAAGLIPLLIRLSFSKRNLEDMQNRQDNLSLRRGELLPFTEEPQIIERPAK